jgi:hypothetical protein
MAPSKARVLREPLPPNAQTLRAQVVRPPGHFLFIYRASSRRPSACPQRRARSACTPRSTVGPSRSSIESSSQTELDRDGALSSCADARYHSQENVTGTSNSGAPVWLVPFRPSVAVFAVEDAMH